MKIFCWTVIFSVLVVPPLFLDLYPFSVFPMYSDNCSEHLILDITDLDSNPLSPRDYGLVKMQLAIRDQRYGYDLPTSYFDKHQELSEAKLRSFLTENYREQVYPIVVRYRVRGFDEKRGKVANIVEPMEIVVDLNTTPDLAHRKHGAGK